MTRAIATVLFAVVTLGGCPETQTRAAATNNAPARVDPTPARRHNSHEHGLGAPPHNRDPHHHHLHPHPHLDGVKGHHHPY